MTIFDIFKAPTEKTQNALDKISFTTKTPKKRPLFKPKNKHRFMGGPKRASKITSNSVYLINLPKENPNIPKKIFKSKTSFKSVVK